MSIIEKFTTRLRKGDEKKTYEKQVKAIHSSKTYAGLDINSIPASFENALREDKNIGDAINIADEALFRTNQKTFFINQKVAASILAQVGNAEQKKGAGKFIEMATGEGKTLAFALAAAIISKENAYRVTVVTANEYLAERDFLANKKFLNTLGVSCGVITSQTSKADRISAYQQDVIYTTLRETAYDYLRDGKSMKEDELMRPIRDSLLVDEADNVLVDNAASPYIISEEVTANEPLIKAALDFAIQSNVSTKAEEEHYILSEKDASLYLSQKGLEKVESFLIKHQFLDNSSSLYQVDNLHIVHLFENAGRAIHDMKQGIDYVVNNERVVVLDKNSGRPLWGISLSNGLQQLLEMKHQLPVTKESVPINEISTESIAMMFMHVTGMSGTLVTDEDELIAVYGKGCITVPSSKPLRRIDKGDVFFLSGKEKLLYILERIRDAHIAGRPVLVSTTNETDANTLSASLDNMNIKNELLIAKSIHEEAGVIALAGRPYRVTITTGVAGRGTDIVLGGNLDHFIENNLIDVQRIDEAREQQEKEKQDVINAGGLLVIGCGRQQLRKLDYQLMGRSGRQGDPGESIFVSSLDDDIFGEHGAVLKAFFHRLSIKDTDMLSHASITKAIIENQNGIRDRMLRSRRAHASLAIQLEEQRNIIYTMRMNILTDNASYEDEHEHQKALKFFDDVLFSYESGIANLKRSIFFQTYANKDPVQEIKKKAFYEYQHFVSRVSESPDFPVYND